MQVRTFDSSDYKVTMENWEPGTYIQWWINDGLKTVVGPIGDYNPKEVMEIIRNHVANMVKFAEEQIRKNLDERTNLPPELSNLSSGTDVS